MGYSWEYRVKHLPQAMISRGLENMLGSIEWVSSTLGEWDILWDIPGNIVGYLSI